MAKLKLLAFLYPSYEINMQIKFGFKPNFWPNAKTLLLFSSKAKWSKKNYKNLAPRKYNGVEAVYCRWADKKFFFFGQTGKIF